MWTKAIRLLHSSSKFSLPYYLFTLGLFQDFLFCLYSTYLCDFGSTSLSCLLATLHSCYRSDRENFVFLTIMTINNKAYFDQEMCNCSQISEKLSMRKQQLVIVWCVYIDKGYAFSIYFISQIYLPGCMYINIFFVL